MQKYLKVRFCEAECLVFSKLQCKSGLKTQVSKAVLYFNHFRKYTAKNHTKTFVLFKSGVNVGRKDQLTNLRLRNSIPICYNVLDMICLFKTKFAKMHEPLWNPAYHTIKLKLNLFSKEWYLYQVKLKKERRRILDIFRSKSVNVFFFCLWTKRNAQVLSEKHVRREYSVKRGPSIISKINSLQTSNKPLSKFAC